ncbi:Hypothetical predicted protein [Mytilus galloprovincialis]|uniref:B box-type domain-containing protein n=1 Tax=Mytilus galloprovincialis TaxID=29158 RepID=A0A8B6BQM1_MYTGA|nr:Hypothetical predicted protein [Mytilus galloprovincialis]
MASSLRKAQSLLSCQLCDNPNVIKWKCQDCVMLMCDNCKERVHPKFKSSETHTVISIRDVRTEKDDMSAQSGELQKFKPVISSVLKTFTTDFPLIGKIQYSGNDTIYCNYNSAECGCKFFIMRLLNESVKILQSVDISYTDFALDTNDDIYFGEYGDSKLQVMSTDGVTKTIFSTSPMIILGIHINKNKEIFLGLREQGPLFPVTDLCTRQIVVFQPKPIKEYAIEFDQNGKKMFSYVWRITTDSDNNIYAIDILESNCNGRIVA